jgi:hypothetical protein
MSPFRRGSLIRWPDHFIQSTAVSPNPKSAGLVLKNGINVIMAQALWIRGVVLVANKGCGLTVAFITAGKPVEPPVPSTDPQDSGSVLVQRHNMIAAQALGIVRIVEKTEETFGARIKLIEAAAFGTDPECAGAIFDDGVNDIITQTVGITGVMHKRLKGVAIVTTQSIGGAKPQKPVAILEDAPNSTTRGADFERQSLEHNRLLFGIASGLICFGRARRRAEHRIGAADKQQKRGDFGEEMVHARRKRQNEFEQTI